MKINIIGTGLFKSGGMRVIYEYGNRLSERGHEVYFYFPLVPYRFGHEDLILMFKRFILGIRDYKSNQYEIKKFYKCVFKIVGIPIISNLFIRDSDALIATQWPTVFDVDKLSLKKGRKIYFLQDYEIWDSDKEKVDRALRLNLKKITISNYNKLFFSKTFNIETEVILNGIEYEMYNCKNKLINRNKVITFIDHHLESKGVANAIEVVKMLHCKYNNLQFMSFGHKKYHNIPDYVKFYKNPDDKNVVDNIYGKTDIFIYPSINEGFALPPAEAMACKCAVVTTNVGAVPEYSEHMKSAIHVEPNNINEMYRAVCYLLDNESEIMRISENGYFYIKKILNWDKSVNEFEKILSPDNK